MDGFFQMRNENVIEVDTESPQEEETGHQRKGHNVAAISEGFGVDADCSLSLTCRSIAQDQPRRLKKPPSIG